MNRIGYIGSSDIASILGISPWKTPYVLYLEKIGEAPPISKEKEIFFARRKLTEKYILSVAELQIGLKTTNINRRFQHKKYDFLSCEVDAEFFCEKTGKDQNIELKSIGDFVKTDDWGEEFTNQIPDYYLTQVMFGIGCSGRDYTKVFGMKGFDNFRQYEVHRDDELIEMLDRRAIKFWQRVIDRNPPPPTTVSDFMIRKPVARSAIATPDIIQMVDKIRKLKAGKKELESLEEDLKLYIGDFEGVVTEGGTALATWKQQRGAHGGLIRVLRIK